MTTTSATFTGSDSYYVIMGCQWTGTGTCPYSWGNCQCGQGIYVQSNPRPNVVTITQYNAPLDRLSRLTAEFATDAKKRADHDHLIERHIRSRRPDRATRFKSKAHVWSTPAGTPPTISVKSRPFTIYFRRESR